jgi:hypothetical protein
MVMHLSTRLCANLSSSKTDYVSKSRDIMTTQDCTERRYRGWRGDDGCWGDLKKNRLSGVMYFQICTREAF